MGFIGFSVEVLNVPPLWAVYLWMLPLPCKDLLQIWRSSVRANQSKHQQEHTHHLKHQQQRLSQLSMTPTPSSSSSSSSSTTCKCILQHLVDHYPTHPPTSARTSSWVPSTGSSAILRINGIKTVGFVSHIFHEEMDVAQSLGVFVSNTFSRCWCVNYKKRYICDTLCYRFCMVGFVAGHPRESLLGSHAIVNFRKDQLECSIFSLETLSSEKKHVKTSHFNSATQQNWRFFCWCKFGLYLYPSRTLCEHASSSMKHIHFIRPQMSHLSGHVPYLQTFMGSYPIPLHLYHNVGVEFRCCISDSFNSYIQIGTLIHSLDGFEAFVTHSCSKHHSQLETILGLGGIARNLVPSLVTTIRQHRTCTAEKKQTGNLMIESCETYRFAKLTVNVHPEDTWSMVLRNKLTWPRFWDSSYMHWLEGISWNTNALDHLMIQHNWLPSLQIWH